MKRLHPARNILRVVLTLGLFLVPASLASCDNSQPSDNPPINNNQNSVQEAQEKLDALKAKILDTTTTGTKEKREDVNKDILELKKLNLTKEQKEELYNLEYQMVSFEYLAGLNALEKRENPVLWRCTQSSSGSSDHILYDILDDHTQPVRFILTTITNGNEVSTPGIGGLTSILNMQDKISEYKNNEAEIKCTNHGDYLLRYSNENTNSTMEILFSNNSLFGVYVTDKVGSNTISNEYKRTFPDSSEVKMFEGFYKELLKQENGKEKE